MFCDMPRPIAGDGTGSKGIAVLSLTKYTDGNVGYYNWLYISPSGESQYFTSNTHTGYTYEFDEFIFNHPAQSHQLIITRKTDSLKYYYQNTVTDYSGQESFTLTYVHQKVGLMVRAL